LSWERLGAELAGADPGRHDELLAALVRVARSDPDATTVIVGALTPGLRARIARHAPGLSPDDAWSIAVDGLCSAVAAGPVAEQFVASRLLDVAKRHLQRAIAAETRWRSHDRQIPERPATERTDEPSGALILTTAVAAGILTPADAWLLHTTAMTGHSLAWAARRLDISYEAAKKRRQRAAGRWRDWWDPPAQRAHPCRPGPAHDGQRPAPSGGQEPAA
jgi:hypothetical protein